MARYCFLDLPVELIHTVFQYLLAHEIYFSFYGVNDRMNSILQSYSDYRFDLKSIQKDHFDLISRHIRSEQVTSFILSDDINTYGQSELFFFRFPIEQFTQLRSLTLIEIDFELSKYIISNLHQFNQLSVLSFNDRSIKYRYPLQVRPAHDYLTNVNTGVLSKLKRLKFGSATDLTSIQFPHLRHLTLQECSTDELNSIFQHVPKLKSLSVCLNLGESRSELNLLPEHLTQLSLEIENHRISMNTIEQLLSKMPQLQHLTLKAHARNDVADGYLWQILASSLITFNFKFHFLNIDTNEILDSFRTPFWLEEKRWFVAYQYHSLFSTPHFGPFYIDSFSLSNIRSTLPGHSFILRQDNSPLFSYVNKFTLNTRNINTNYRFTHIKTLELQFSISFRTIEGVVDLNRVKHLVVPSLNNLLTFIPLKYKLPQLYKLSVTNSVTNDTMTEIQCYQFKQILQIKFNIIDEQNNHIMKLFRLFPCAQHFRCSSIKSTRSMIYLIDGFKDLSNASFSVTDSFINCESYFFQNPNTVIKHSKRLTKNNFKCRIYRQSFYSDQYDLVWWIGENLLT